MAGKPKKGIEFAGWYTNLFEADTKIDKLLEAQGWKGFGAYFFLCQKAFASDGYFYRWGYDDCPSTAKKMGGGMTSETVEETVKYCLRIGLFEKGLFDKWGILTSRGIQRSFLVALMKRRSKEVIYEYWLLPDDESKGLLKCALNNNVPPTNGHVQDANSDVPMTDGQMHPYRIGYDTILDDSDSIRENAPNLHDYLESFTGIPLKLSEIELMISWQREFSYQEITQAINAANENGIREISYVDSILKLRAREV